MSYVRIAPGAVPRMVRDPSGPVYRWSTRLGLSVRNGAVQRCNVDTGLLRSSITFDVEQGPNGLVVVVGSPLHYARWVHEGRGVVYPVNARALRWVTPSGQVVFARSSSAYAGNPFLRDAVLAEVASLAA